MSIQKIKHSFNKELPGEKAHMKMVPLQDGKPFRTMNPPDIYNHSAVLILLSGDDELDLLFTLRSSKLRKHSGQISFPGGRLDEGEDYVQAALRETWEEVGIEENNIDVLGKISPLYVPPSNSLIQPIVAHIPETPKLILNPDEVEKAFKVPLNKFYEKDIIKYRKWNFANGESDVPFYDVHPTVPLWGATAIMLSELLELIQDDFSE